MAKKQQPKAQARGMLSDPRQGRFEGGPRDRGANPGVRLGKEKFGRRSKYPGVSQDQRAVLNQMEASDLALGDMGQAMMPGIQRNFEQPFDRSALPQSPWEAAGDVQGLYDKYYEDTLSDYERVAAPQFQKQAQEFDTWAVQRGIPVGSQLYNDEKKRLLDTQEGQRQTMRTQAMQGAGSQANLWNTMQGQNFQGAYDFENAERNRPLTEYNLLRGSQSGLAEKALDQSYARQNAKWALAQQPSGGGGGGGGGSGYMYQQYGFATPQEYDQYKLQQSMAAKEAEYALANKYAPKGANPYAGAAGGILGGISQGIGAGIGKGIAGWF